MYPKKIKYNPTQKVTVMCQDSNIVVYDKNGHMFYIHPVNDGKVVTFNLPPGEYYSNNTLRPAEHFQPYEKLDYPDLDFAPPVDIDVKEGFNPHKASYWVKSRHMLVDAPTLRKLNYEPVLYFVIGHEFGHEKINNLANENLTPEQRDAKELACDMYSYNLNMDAGLNPSQIIIAAKLALPHTDRPQHLQKFVELIKTRR